MIALVAKISLHAEGWDWNSGNCETVYLIEHVYALWRACDVINESYGFNIFQFPIAMFSLIIIAYSKYVSKYFINWNPWLSKRSMGMEYEKINKKENSQFTKYDAMI